MAAHEPSRSESAGTTEHLYKVVSENLSPWLQELQESSAIQLKDEDYVRDAVNVMPLHDIWSKMEDTIQLVSKQCTVLCMLHSDNKYPGKNDVRSVVSKLEAATVTLATIATVFPPAQGVHAGTQLKLLVISIIQTVLRLFKEASEHSSPATLRSIIGNIWEYCDAFAKLPRDNKSAVLSTSKSCLSLVADAFQELEEAVLVKQTDNPDILSSDWSELDRNAATECLGVIKTCRYSIKRTIACIEEKADVLELEKIKQLDKIIVIINDIVAVNDDFVCSLFGPLDSIVALETLEKLTASVQKLFNFLEECHFYSDADRKWSELLQNALKHNHQKVVTALKNTQADEVVDGMANGMEPAESQREKNDQQQQLDDSFKKLKAI